MSNLTSIKDIGSLKDHLGEPLGPSNWVTITQEMINQFADVTGDHQWIHLDAERAKRESPFGTTVAHGFLTLSLLPKLSAQDEPPYVVVGFGNVTNYGSDKLRFLTPVPAGAKVHAHSRLVSVEAGKKGTRHQNAPQPPKGQMARLWYKSPLQN